MTDSGTSKGVERDSRIQIKGTLHPEITFDGVSGKPVVSP